MNVCMQLKRITPDEYFAYLKEEIDRFKKTPDAVEFTFDFHRMNHNAYDEIERFVTRKSVAEFLESVDVIPAFGTGTFAISCAQFNVYKTEFKGKPVMYCTVDTSYRYHPRIPACNENAEF